MYSRLRILYLILLIATILAFILFFFQNLQLSALSFLHLQSFLPVSLGFALSFFLGLLTALFSRLFISANRQAMFGESEDTIFRDEEL